MLKKMNKKCLVALLLLNLGISCFPVQSVAKQPIETEQNIALGIQGTSGSKTQNYSTEERSLLNKNTLSYTCGENVSWSFDENTGVLRIFGTGAISDYGYDNESEIENEGIDDTRPEFDIFQSKITSLVIEEGVTSIGKYTFQKCRSLTDVTLPNTLTSIGMSAFADCSSLKNITLPENLLSIEEFAFEGCEALEKIRIPQKLETLENSAFSKCVNLKGFEVAEENTNFFAEDGVLFDKEQTKICCFPMAYPNFYYEIPESVRTMYKVSFSGVKYLKNLIIKGSPFSLSHYQDLKGLNVYYDWEGENVEKYLKSWTQTGATLFDLKDTPGLLEQNTLLLKAETNQLKVGETIELLAQISPLLVGDFLWKSSNETVAMVSGNGKLIALHPGTTTIQVTSADGKYSAQANFQVTGNAFSIKDGNYVELSKELLQYENAFDVTKQIVSEKLQGIYFLNQEKLSFYSFASGNHYVAHTFPGCDSAYVAKDMLYILSENVCYTYDLNTQSLKSEFKVVGYQTTAVGADPKGRIYIAASRFDNPDTNEILLFSPEGKKLSEMKVGTDVYEFLGFDSGNGRFYMESYQKCYSLNKGRDGRGLTMGQVTGNSLKYIDTHYEFLENGVGPIDMSCILCLCEEESLKQIGSG